MKTVRIKVEHYYRHVIYYPFMSTKLYDILEEAFYNKEHLIEVPEIEYTKMINQYLDTLKN